MESKEEILDLVHQYLVKFPEEDAKPIISFIQDHEGEAIFSRNNFDGHITASAFITDEKAELLLLLKHTSLNRWLQPGGHVDIIDNSLIASALREATEETGLSADVLKPLSNTIFDIDSHTIPANLKKQEPEHIHHDVRFLFQCSNSLPLKISLEESEDSKWIQFSELKGDADFGKIAQKIQLLTTDDWQYVLPNAQ